MDLPALLLLLLALAATAALFYRLGRRNTAATPDPAAEAAAREEAVRRDTLLQQAEERVGALEEERARSQEEVTALRTTLATREAELQQAREQLSQQHEEQAKAEERLAARFRELSQQILEAQSERLGKAHEERLGQILQPTRQRLAEFREAVEGLREQGTRQHGELKAHIEQLGQGSATLSAEARNLTDALKGQKTQGNWGEMLLEKVLESSGLRKDHEYRLQPSFSSEGSSRLQPDAIVDLPEGRHLVIDAKVSLTAYQRWVAAEDKTERATTLREHIDSLRSHIKGLAEKHYDTIPELRTPDMVLLFIPVEPAFSAALQARPELFEEAYARRIVLVTPANLLATLKVVASLWRQERQNESALAIAEIGSRLHDKLVAFADSMDDIGQRLEQAHGSWDKAKRRLNGHGGAVSLARRMVDKGVKARKEMPTSWSESLPETDPPNNP